MPRVIEAETEESIELGDLVEALETGDFDARDEDNLASWGGMLKKLANNRSFLADIVVDELKSRCSGQFGVNDYNSQVIMLYAKSDRFVLRANFWPALTDSVVKHSGTAPFLYDVPHDHNFSFLTVGYLGPGYWSDYYEADYDRIVGFEGEKVDLRFIEKARLEPGKVMLYRRHRDVHRQLPADAMSVSLNIMEAVKGGDYLDQYVFDTERSCIATIMNRLPVEPLLALSAHFGGEKGKELLDHYARHHPSPRAQMSAIGAQAAAAGSLDDRIAVFESAAQSADPYVAAMAALRARKLAEGRGYFEERRG